MPDFLPYLGQGLTVIVALWAFKRARDLSLAAQELSAALEQKKAYLAIGELQDELAELVNAVERNRETMARFQGRRRKIEAVDSQVPDPARDPAAWKRAMRAQAHLTGIKGNGT